MIRSAVCPSHNSGMAPFFHSPAKSLSNAGLMAAGSVLMSSFALRLLNHRNNRCHLHKIRPGPRNQCYLHKLFSYLPLIVWTIRKFRIVAPFWTIREFRMVASQPQTTWLLFPFFLPYSLILFTFHLAFTPVTISWPSRDHPERHRWVLL